MNLRRTTPAALATVALLATACSNPISSPGPEVAGVSATSALRQVAGATVVAAGDIACAPGLAPTETTCQHAATAELAAQYQPRRVLGLGDQQYESGTLSEFRESYTPTWGALKSVTKPVPGNHEYHANGAAGYYRYFRNQQPGAPGYYAFNVDSWRVYALNSNCALINCVRQKRWLNRNMANHPRKCSAITMHHPRYSSGKHGPNISVKRFWRVALRHRTDLALAGHDHSYERFDPMNAAGARTPTGIASFVSGAGGKTLYPFRAPSTGSMARHNDTFGVLALRLGKGNYAWEYQTVEGEVIDSGTRRCT